MDNRGIEFIAQGEMDFCDLGEAPEPGPGQVRIRTLYSGITNGTERHALMAEHGYGAFPGRHGYQHVGRVDAIGSSVHQFSKGDVVFYGDYVGHRAWHVVDVNTPGRLCIKIPEGVEPEFCALLGVAGVGTRGARRCRVEAGQRVWVVGAGLIGQFAAQAARAFGAHVTISDVHTSRLGMARTCGAHRVLDASASDYEDLVKVGGPYHRIIDACGIPSLFHDIQRMGVLGHRSVIAAIAVRRETQFNWGMLHVLECSIEVSCHFSLEELSMLLFFLQQGTLHVEPLVTHRVSIDDAPSIYATMRDHPRELLGVVFQW